jgi:hypothetical protein
MDSLLLLVVVLVLLVIRVYRRDLVGALAESFGNLLCLAIAGMGSI